jgi:hypothetical protein
VQSQTNSSALSSVGPSSFGTLDPPPSCQKDSLSNLIGPNTVKYEFLMEIPCVYIKRCLPASAVQHVLNFRVALHKNATTPVLLLLKQTSIEIKSWTNHLKTIVEQPVHGLIRDGAVLSRLDPKNGAADLLACVSDSGMLSILAFDVLKGLRCVEQVEIASPGIDMDNLGARIATDPLYVHL